MWNINSKHIKYQVKKNLYGGGGDGGEMLLINKYSWPKTKVELRKDFFFRDITDSVEGGFMYMCFWWCYNSML